MLLLEKICIHIKKIVHIRIVHITHVSFVPFNFFLLQILLLLLLVVFCSLFLSFIGFVLIRIRCCTRHFMCSMAIVVVWCVMCCLLTVCVPSLSFDIRSGFLSSRLLLLAVCRLYIYARVFSIALYGHERYKKNNMLRL